MPLSPTNPLADNQKPSRVVKMFAALSATNEAILRVNSKEELLQQVCDAALQSGNFLAAAIVTSEPGQIC